MKATVVDTNQKYTKVRKEIEVHEGFNLHVTKMF